ncbi:hypothetical protein ACI2K4_26040 [Micromonospora sp. NPDC050397]|uniref:hypothetical protein n=1 Tax=Micromonospora sp. NPDC050397 TaxID=3364279 RepID=UPI00384A9290
MWIVIGLVTGVVTFVLVFVVLPPDKGWVFMGPLWILAGGFCLVFRIGVDTGTFSGPGISSPPLPVAVLHILVSLAMILNGLRLIRNGLRE